MGLLHLSLNALSPSNPPYCLWLWLWASPILDISLFLPWCSLIRRLFLVRFPSVLRVIPLVYFLCNFSNNFGLCQGTRLILFDDFLNFELLTLPEHSCPVSNFGPFIDSNFPKLAFGTVEIDRFGQVDLVAFDSFLHGWCFTEQFSFLKGSMHFVGTPLLKDAQVHLLFCFESLYFLTSMV